MNMCENIIIWLQLILQVGVLIAAWVAISRWRKNEKWKYDFLLADKALVGFYRMQAIINEIRNPWASGGEFAARVKGENESQGESRALDAYYVTIERLKRHIDYLSDFRAKRFEVIVRFGDETASLFDEMIGALNDVTYGAERYVQESKASEKFDRPHRVIPNDPTLRAHDEQKRDESHKRLREAEELIWSGGENDAHAKKVADILERAQKKLRPYLKE